MTPTSSLACLGLLATSFGLLTGCDKPKATTHPSAPTSPTSPTSTRAEPPRDSPPKETARPEKTTPLAKSAISNDDSCRRLLTKEAISAVWPDLNYDAKHVTTFWKEERHTNAPGICIYTDPEQGELLKVVQIPLKEGEAAAELFKTNTKARASSRPTEEEVSQRTLMLRLVLVSKPSKWKINRS